MDLEMEIIGVMIEATDKGRAAQLDTGAWQRIEAYARSLCRQGEREAGEREAAIAKAERDARKAAIPAPEPRVHILR